jgi:predicted TIM-barrel fold metal-dependent hydrolase
MIIDAHCHAWRSWPYEPPVPDPDSRGAVEQLLWEMDRNGVDQAAVVCARIDHNPDNNDYVAECARRYPDRLHQFADVDCSWTDTYHTPGAAKRLEESVARYGHKGFTHYVKGEDDGGWFLSEEGDAFLAAAARLNQILSIACGPRVHPVLRQVAARFPSLVILCHHMAGLRAAEPPPRPLLEEVLRSAALPNISVKLSGFHYASAVPYGFPFADCAEVVQRLYAAYGPDRLCWGSDYPVVRKALTYQQALEALRSHCDFIPDEHKALILGENLRRLLAERG